MTELVRVYPTHLRNAGPLTVHVGTEEVVITDDGADIDPDLAEQLVRFRDATTEAPDQGDDDDAPSGATTPRSSSSRSKATKDTGKGKAEA